MSTAPVSPQPSPTWNRANCSCTRAGSALLMSLVLRDPPRLLPLLAAVAVCDAVAEPTQGMARVKWPNDIVVPGAVVGGDEERLAGGRPALSKLAGILAEGRPQEGWV